MVSTILLKEPAWIFFFLETLWDFGIEVCFVWKILVKMCLIVVTTIKLTQLGIR